MNSAELVKQYGESKKILMAQLKENFGAEIKQLFVKHNQVHHIRFSAYTPYFNDGEPCTYSVNYYDVDILDKNDNHLSESIIYGSAEYQNYRNISKEFTSFLKVFPNEFYEDVFGDHIQITIYSDGKVETTDCEHD